MTCIGVTGATGFLGSALCKSFAMRGWPVVAFSRCPQQGAGMGHRYYDLGESREPALHGVDVLVHAAHDVRARPGDESVNFEGARRLISAAASAGVRQIVFISSMAASSGSASHYGREKHAIESLLNPSRDLIVRPGLIVGNGGLFRSMYRTATRYHVVPLFSGGMQPVYVVGIDDLCASVVDLVANGANGIHAIANPDPVPLSALYRAIAKKARTPLLMLPLPLGPVLAFVSLLERVGAKLPIDSERLNGLRNLRIQSVTPATGVRTPLSSIESLMESVRIS